MKKIQCQLIAWVRTPPASSPIDPPAGGDEGEHAQRFGLLAHRRELGDDDRDDHRGGDRAADALNEASGDQQPLAVGEAAERRGGGEQRQAAEEYLLAADQVPEPPSQQQEAAEGDQVGVDHPGQVGLGEVQVALDRGQGDIDDRRVQHDHQLAQAEDDQRDPAAAVVRGCLGFGHRRLRLRGSTGSEVPAGLLLVVGLVPKRLNPHGRIEMKLGRLIARIVIGGLFVGHGTQKWFGWFDGPGLEGTSGMMESLGMRPRRRNAIAASASETIGGAMIVAGAFTPAAAATLIATMITAIRTVHLKNGLWASKGGYEFNLALIAGLLALVDGGPGSPSVDAPLGIGETGPGWALVALAAGATGSTLAIAAGHRHSAEGEGGGEAA